MADSRYLVLARKWRPQQFEDVVGQEHITRTLRNAISSGRIHHAFLFIGSRGIGKTTTARILAKALNCETSDAPTVNPCGECGNCESIGSGSNIDVIEIDGASNNGVDDIREIRDNIRMVPTHGRYKVYIIDEVHQLSSGAFNALLKTLEEPPPHAVFVLATTEAHKIPATIISRCQRYDFRRVKIPEIVTLLRQILDREGLSATDAALHAIARAAEGGVRDSESILDELITYCDGEITFEAVFDVLGLVDWQLLHRLCDALLEKNVVELLAIVEEVVAGGKDLSQFVQEILRYFRNLLVARTTEDTALLQLPDEEAAEIGRYAQRFTLTQLVRLVEQFAELTSGFDSQIAQRIALESLLIRVSKASVELSVDAVLEKLLLLGQGGIAPAPEGAAQPPPKPANPPEAGPIPTAPPVPAEKGRAAVTQANLAAAWGRIAAHAGEENLNLRVWAVQAAPQGIKDGALLLAFPADGKQARDIVERPEHRAALEQAMAALTSNLKTFRTQLLEPEEGPDAFPPDEPAGSAPSFPGANPEEVRVFMEDPKIAVVIDAFKGRIVDIKHPTAVVPPTE